LKTHGIRLIAVICFILLAPVWMSGEEEDYEIRPNNPDWISFGPGLIYGCKSARVYLAFPPPAVEILIRDPRRLKRLQDWTWSLFGRKFNMTPKNPEGRAVDWPECIIFYYDGKGSPSKWVVGIPLIYHTMGQEEEEIDRKMEELHKIVKPD